MTLVQMVNQPYDLVKQQVVPFMPLLVRFGASDHNVYLPTGFRYR